MPYTKEKKNLMKVYHNDSAKFRHNNLIFASFKLYKTDFPLIKICIDTGTHYKFVFLQINQHLTLTVLFK